MSNPYMEDNLDDENQFIANDVKSKKGVYFAVLVMLGLLNNLGYVLVNSSAQDLGKQFGEQKFMALFTFSLTALGVATAFFNARYLLKIRHYNKIKIMLTCYTVAYLCVGISNLMSSFSGFVLCLFGSVIMGVSTTLGEQTNLGFLKGFAPDLISGWACGTGFAGVFGAGINFLLRFVNIPGYLIFLGMIPMNLIYFVGFRWLKNQKVDQIEKTEERVLTTKTQGRLSFVAENDKDKEEASINQTISVVNFKRVWPHISYLALNLAAVYFLEYTIITGFADIATDQYADSTSAFEKNAFILLNLCYQVGVVISRTSLECFKIRKIWIVTLLQLFNFFLWSWIAYDKEIRLEYLLPMMVFVGLMGGASYVNVIYLTLESERVEKKDKEISLNIEGMCNSTGTMLTTLFSLLLENTLYKNK